MTSRILFITKYFDILGFKTKFSTKAHKSHLDHLNIFIHIVIITAIIFFNTKVFLNSPLGELDLEVANSYIQVINVSVTYWLIITDLYRQTETRKSFWKLYHEIEKNYCNQRHFTWRSFKFKLIALNLNCFAILIHFISVSYVLDLDLFLTITLYVFSVQICETILLQYWFFLEVILYQLKAIETELIQLNYSKEYFKMQSVKKFYAIVSEMVDQMNEIFGWSLFAGIFFCFIFLLTNLNWMICHSIHEASTFDVLGEL